MLRDDVAQTIALARASLEAARKAAESGESDGFFVDTLGISEDEKNTLRDKLANGNNGIDPVVSMLVGATNGIGYKGKIGRLDRYPIPELRLDEADSASFLDIGCSWGRWSIAAARKGYRVAGIDPSLGAVLAARRVARSMGLDILYVVGDARYLPFRNTLFDQVFSYSVLQHLAKSDVERVLDDVARVLKPGGRVGLTTWAEDCPFVNWQREALRPYVQPPGPHTQADREAPRFDTPATVEAALQQAGFERRQILVEEGEFVHANDEEVWARLWSGGPRRQLEQMTGPVLDQVKRDVLQKVQVFKQPDGIHLRWRAVYALGDKPHR
jgi:SAM-dependent methyltransferase